MPHEQVAGGCPALRVLVGVIKEPAAKGKWVPRAPRCKVVDGRCAHCGAERPA